MHTNLQPGTMVLTSDGEELGTVKEVRGAFFKVDAPMARDYWLACEIVSADLPLGGVRVMFTRPELDEHRLGEPATAE